MTAVAEHGLQANAKALVDTYSEEKCKALFAKFVKNGTWWAIGSEYGHRTEAAARHALSNGLWGHTKVCHPQDEKSSRRFRPAFASP